MHCWTRFRLLPRPSSSNLLSLLPLPNPSPRGSHLLYRRRRPRAPPRLLGRLLFRIAVHGQRARRVDRRVAYAADLPVGLVFAKERFPVLDALK